MLNKDEPSGFKLQREQFKVEIRKEHNENIFSQSRIRIHSSPPSASPALRAFAGENPTGSEAYINQKTGPLNEKALGSLVEMKKTFLEAWESQNFEAILKEVRRIRETISREKNSPIIEFLDLGLEDYFLEMLKSKYAPLFELQHEVSWIISNICSVPASRLLPLINKDLVNLLKNLLGNSEFFENVFWAFSNMSGENLEVRDHLIKNDIIDVFMGCFNSLPTKSLGQLRVISWFISNMCRGRPYPPFEKVKCFMPILGDLICFKDIDTVSEALWALVFIVDGGDYQISQFLKLNKLGRLMELMKAVDFEISYPAFRIFGGIMNSNMPNIASEVIKHGALSSIKYLLSVKKKPMRREVCWALSNLIATSSDIVQKIIDESNIFQKLTMILVDDFWEVKREATFCIYNATMQALPSQMSFFKNLRLHEVLLQNLELQESSVVYCTLKTLNNFFENEEKKKFLPDEGNDETPMLTPGNSEEFLVTLEKLQTHPNTDIANLVQKIIIQNFQCQYEANGIEIEKS